ncbi:M24 family metallopeptidase [Pleomorphomonas carboxyditropha]|uniref:Peptidase M24 n=1 Tax=Pleomorphomonas carboxyditropha TaxID=2023338 RepID=A0A2G9X0K0_9HYPH|nr:Xaa-Pro peptidase family protein [Pleomorphomonas carboxyditropha]PIP00123.1 peptidase M24 [Pleomorphomonas carboxyditropha]
MSPSTTRRLAALRSCMAKAGVGLVAVAPGSHMDWIVGFHPHADERPCLLLIGPEREAFLMPALNADGARTFTDIAFHTWADEAGPDEALRAALADAGAAQPGRVALDECMRLDFGLLLLDALPAGTAREFTASTLGALRMRKDADEYAELKRNALIADRAMLAAFAALRPGMTELELANVVKAHFLSEEAAPQFWIVGAAGNGAFPHHTASDRVIEAGDAVVIDIGGRNGMFPSDITRMAIVGPAPEGYDAVHAVVEAAVRAGLAAARPGVAAREVDAAARGVIAAAGYGDYFLHRTGHGMGIDGHEPPFLTATSETVLDEGMVFSIEPGIYLPSRFGIRLEEIVILRKDGPEILSELPRTVFRKEA